MPMLDIFNSDAFSVVSLTDAINKLKFVPGYLGASGLFAETGITTTSVAIEQKNNVLVLVPPTPRGGPGVTLDKGKRSMLSINVPHFEINDAVYAEEVQNIRPFGQESGEDSVMRLVGERMQTDGRSQEATIEYSRLGAVKGVVTYADGSTLDLFATFGVAQAAEVNFDLQRGAGTGRAAEDLRGRDPHHCGGARWHAVHRSRGDLRRCVLRQPDRASGSAGHVHQLAGRRRTAAGLCARRPGLRRVPVWRHHVDQLSRPSRHPAVHQHGQVPHVCFGFFTLDPVGIAARAVGPRETIPSRPNLQGCRNRSGPIPLCS